MAAAGIPTASPEPSSSPDELNDVVSATASPQADVPEDVASASPEPETTSQPEETEAPETGATAEPSETVAPDAELTPDTETESGGAAIDMDALVAQIVAELEAGEADYSETLGAILLSMQNQEEHLEALLVSEQRQEKQLEAGISILLWLLIIVILYFIYRFLRIFV